MKGVYDNKKITKKIIIAKILYFILLIGMTFCLALFGCCMFIPNLSYLLKIFYSLLAGEETLIVVTHIVNEKSQKDFNNLCSDIYKDCRLFIHEKSYDEIKIIPKNIQIGWDLEAANAVPIFKKGKYIIIPNSGEYVILREYEENNNYIVDLLDYDDVDSIKSDLTPRQLKLICSNNKLEGKNYDKDR